MASGENQYLPRFEYPELLEKGRNNLVVCPVYRNGAIAAPSSGTLTVYDAAGNVVATPSVSITGSVATATITSASLSSKSYEEHWRLEWVLTISSVAYTYRKEAALVRVALAPVVTDADILRRHPGLDDLLPTSNTGFQDQILEAWAEIQQRLYSKGRRPQLIASPSAFRTAHLYLALAITFEGFHQHASSQAYQETAARYWERFEHAWKELSTSLDYDEDGTVDEPLERRTLASPTFLTSPGAARNWRG